MKRHWQVVIAANFFLMIISLPASSYTKEERFCRGRLSMHRTLLLNQGAVGLYDPDVFYYDCMKTASEEMEKIEREKRERAQRRAQEAAKMKQIRTTDINNLFD